jgi:hypothetical protein
VEFGEMKKIIGLIALLSMASLIGIAAFGGQMDLTGAGYVLLFAVILVIIERATR